MHRENDETVVISSLDRYVQEMQQLDASDPAFGIQDLLKIRDGDAALPGLVLDLLKIHFSTQEKAFGKMSLKEYFQRFPRHRCWEHLLGTSQEATQVETAAWSERKTVLNSSDSAVSEFAHSPLSRLPTNLQLELRSLMKVQDYHRQERILCEGAVGDRLIVVISGMIHIVSECPGQPATLLGTAVVGDVIGEMSLIGSRPCTASAIAHGHCRVLSLAAEEFHRLRSAHPELAQVITEIVATRLGNEQHDALSFKSVNGYTIARRLGRGGMSVVYDAVHQASRQRVALKMMSHRLVYDDRSRRLFESEARIVSAFQHPNIPRIYDRFDDFGTSFMAIEYVEGIPVTDVIKHSQPLAEELAAAILGQIAAALGHAHQAGVVHRDVKPANCLLRNDGNVKLTDFGLSIQMLPDRQQNQAVMGTLAYMAPEQLAGDPPRPQSDWFSLGLLAVELATGRRVLNPRGVLSLHEMYQNWDPRRYSDLMQTELLRDFVFNSLQLNPADRQGDVEGLMRRASEAGNGGLAALVRDVQKLANPECDSVSLPITAEN